MILSDYQSEGQGMANVGRFEVKTTRESQKQVNNLPLAVKSRVFAAFVELKNFPKVSNITKLAGSENTWRKRVGDYRILFTVESEIVTIVVIKVAHRREAYE
jgi:mRNA interferase RelE/StbE